MHIDSLPILDLVYLSVDCQAKIIVILFLLAWLGLLSILSLVLLVFFELDIFLLLSLEFHDEGASYLAKARLDEKGSVKRIFEASEL